MAIPNTTPTPNELYNGEMRKMGDTDLRVVMVVTRATLGWEIDKETGMRKQEDWISNYQLREKTGRSGRAISTAIDICIKNGWIEARNKVGELLDTKEKRSGKKIYYRLGRIFLNKITSEKSSKVLSTSEKSSIEKSSIEKSSLYKRNSITKETLIQKSSPYQIAKEFFNEYDKQEQIILIINKKTGTSIDIISQEIKKFIAYWTEPNKSGTKQRWEIERTFELSRRLTTWFNNIKKFSNQIKGITL